MKPSTEARETPGWAAWPAAAKERPYSLGVEEEVMLLNPKDFSLADEIDAVLPVARKALGERVTAETHTSALELATGVNTDVASAARELLDGREHLERELEPIGLRAASAGTHPFAVWNETKVSSGERYQFVYGSMRELARREPTFALHVHVGVADPEDAINLVNRMRAHLPLLLALSVNSPFWQGRDTGLSSSRTPLFQAFPRVGIPRRFEDYSDYVETVDLLLRCEAFPEPTFLWWDIRPQPRFGTVEVRIMDAQTTTDETAALVALVQSVAKLEIEEGFVDDALCRAPEVLDENRFLAARDGMHARLIFPRFERRISVRELLGELIQACEPHAQDLGCTAELEGARQLAQSTGAARQLAVSREGDRLDGLVSALADSFTKKSDDASPARLGIGMRY